MPIIDAHQHFWQLSQPFNYKWLAKPQLAAINRDYLPDDLRPHLDAVGVTRTIFVQTQHDLNENRWALMLAEQHDWIAGVVGWVDLASPACEDQLLEFRRYPKFVGVRHVVQDEPDDEFILRPDVLRGLKVLQKHGVPFDLLFYVKHLKHAVKVAHAVPNLTLVLDHLSKPDIKHHKLTDWLPYFKTAAACPNIVCKLSGLITEADWMRWSVHDLHPFTDRALELFGPERLLYGSDWPVCELAGSYRQVYEAARELLAKCSAAEQEKIFGGNAARVYSITAADM